jgi:hypothetical protein
MTDVDNFRLQDVEDKIIWKMGKNKTFSMNFMYNALTKSNCGFSHNRIWKGKVLPKIKIFMWLMSNDAILTKDNMIRRRWVGNPRCYFCEQDESINHLFFTCPVARVVWGVIAKLIGANNIPTSLEQCWMWCER